MSSASRHAFLVALRCLGVKLPQSIVLRIFEDAVVVEQRVVVNPAPAMTAARRRGQQQAFDADGLQMDFAGLCMDAVP